MNDEHEPGECRSSFIVHRSSFISMIRSMTGFGRASGALSPRYSVAVMAKSVNHRFLEATVRLPDYLWDVEPLIRAVGAEIFTRGKLDVSVRGQRTLQAEATVRINTH